MHDRLFAGQEEWAKSAGVARVFDGYAAQLGLDMPAFRDCTANDHTAAVVMGDAIEAAAGGVNGTPAFFLIGPGGRRPIAGAVSWPVLQRELETVLAPAAPGQTPPTAPDSTPGR